MAEHALDRRLFFDYNGNKHMWRIGTDTLGQGTVPCPSPKKIQGGSGRGREAQIHHWENPRARQKNRPSACKRTGRPMAVPAAGTDVGTEERTDPARGKGKILRLAMLAQDDMLGKVRGFAGDGCGTGTLPHQSLRDSFPRWGKHRAAPLSHFATALPCLKAGRVKCGEGFVVNERHR